MRASVMRSSFTTSKRILAVGLLSSTLMAPAMAQTCAVAYRKALDEVRDKRSEPISATLRTVRAANPDLSGGWLFSATLFDPKRKQRTESYCAETAETRRGKSRCVRYAKRTVVPPGEPAIRSSSTPDETRDLEALVQFVELKGAVPELGANGRFGFLFQRIAQDLRTYLGQDPHPALCAGGSDLTEFYEGQIAPLKRRQAEATELTKRTRAAAEARLSALHKAETSAHENAVAIAKAAAAQSAPAEVTASASAAAPPAPLAQEIPARAAPDYAGKPFSQLVASAIYPLATPEQREAVDASASPIKSLALARTVFLAHQAGGASSTPVAPAVLEASGHALRMIEAAVYAEMQRQSYRDIEASIFAAISDIRQAHKSACTCAD